MEGTEMQILNHINATVSQMAQQLAAMLESKQTVGIKAVRDETGRLVGGVQIKADGSEHPVNIQ